MKKYSIQNTIGSGNFSTVFKGFVVSDHSPCAIKVMRAHHQIAIRQALTLKKFKHPNIVALIDFEQSYGQSRIVLQYVGINTLQLYQTHIHGLKQQQVKCILFQTALGLVNVHSQGIIHRDIKPQNILIDKKSAIVKLVDFGLAIDQSKCQTDYIATRWYRAPENLLGTKQYTCAIDVFSLGCVIVQLFIGSALFPGSNNIDQIYKIFSILGHPTQLSWPKGYQKMIDLGIKPKNTIKNELDLKQILNPCDPRLIEVIEKMLEINPKKRITCTEILKHSYFKQIKAIIPPAVYQRFQQDILNNPKSLSFKSLYTVKSYKNLPKQNKFYKKNTKLNHLQLQPKQRQKQNLKIVQRPQFLRQKKSSSLDSNKLANNLPKVSSKCVFQKQKQDDIDTLKRKTSTPSLFIPYSPLIHRKVSPLIFQKQMKNKTFIQPYPEKIGQISKNLSEVIVEDTVSQMKDSNLTPNLSQATTTSKIFLNTHGQCQKKAYSAFVQPQNTKNIFSVIPNIKLVAQVLDQKIYSKTTRNTAPTNNNMSIPQFQFEIHHQKNTVSTIEKNHKNNLAIIDLSRKSLTNQRNQTSKKIQQKKIKRADVKTKNQLNKELTFAEQKNKQTLFSTYRAIDANISKPQVQKIKLDNKKLIARQQAINYKPFLSPTHRYFVKSPQNKFISGRQHKILPVNSISHKLLSPLHRRV